MNTLFSPLQEFWKKGDKLLLLLCLLASAYGVALIYSATRYNENDREVIIQIIAILLGVVVYILCLQPLDTSRCGWLLWGFFAGLASDFFSGVPGVGAVSMTLAAMCAPRILALFAPKDCLEDMVPGYLTLGGWKYVQYVSWLVLLQQAAAVVLEFFSFFNGLELLYTYLCSSALTAVLLLVLEKMRGGR